MKKHLNKILIAFFSIILIISAFKIADYYIEANKQDKIYASLEKTTQETVNNPEQPIADENGVLYKYSEIHSQNTDMVGWIKIDGTKINYPVMLSQYEPNFYLTHGFDKKYTVYGCPYIQEDCDAFTPSDNIIIYGHNMKNGSMFADLGKYNDKSFYDTHQTINFDTIYKTQSYKILAAFECEVNTARNDLFEYYRFVNARTEKEFTDFIDKCKDISFYETGVSAKYGDKLITLSTCSATDKDFRIVVVAKKIDK